MRIPIYIVFGFIILLGTTLLSVFSFPAITDSAQDFHVLTHNSNEVRLLFVGDMMFDRSIRAWGEREGYAHMLSCSSSTLRSYDAVIGNLEGPITNNQSRSLGSIPDTPDNYVFTFAPTVAKVLADFNIKIVNLGNNHIANFGTKGVATTRGYLDKAGVAYFGGLAGDTSVLRSVIGERHFSFINFNEFGGELPLFVADQIRTEKQAGQFVVVFTHWGDEYMPAAEREKTWAKVFASAGADVIIGTHPHVIQEQGMIGRTPVFYSLGNFVFDQYWNDDVSHGEAVEVRIKDASVETKSFLVTLGKDRTTCIGSAL